MKNENEKIRKLKELKKCFKREPKRVIKVINRHESNRNRLFTSRQAAHFLGFRPDYLAKLRISGLSPQYKKLNGRVYYRKIDLVRWVMNLPTFTCTAEEKEVED